MYVWVNFLWGGQIRRAYYYYSRECTLASVVYQEEFDRCKAIVNCKREEQGNIGPCKKCICMPVGMANLLQCALEVGPCCLTLPPHRSEAQFVVQLDPVLSEACMTICLHIPKLLLALLPRVCSVCATYIGSQGLKHLPLTGVLFLPVCRLLTLQP